MQRVPLGVLDLRNVNTDVSARTPRKSVTDTPDSVSPDARLEKKDPDVTYVNICGCYFLFV